MEIRLEKLKKEPETVQDVANNFFMSTTIHGYGRIYRQRGWFRRLLWCGLCIGLTVWALYHILVIITDYYNYPTKINRRVIEDKVGEFPAVTVCNLSPLGHPSSVIEHPIWGTFKKMDQRAIMPACEDDSAGSLSADEGTAGKLAEVPRDAKKTRALEMRKKWLNTLAGKDDANHQDESPLLISPGIVFPGVLPVPPNFPPTRKKRDDATVSDTDGLVNDQPMSTEVSGDAVFICKDGANISVERRCDGRKHCPQGEDETNCTECAEWAYLCDSGLCIHSDQECDFNADCPGADDETTCFVCNDGSLIRPYWTCNGIADCPDGEDEIICSDESVDCPLGYFRCSDDSCVKKELLCDGEYDCPRHLDEYNCDTCQADAYHCESGECVAKHLVCDGQSHCYAGDDEMNCTIVQKKCPIGYFRCDDGPCFNPRFQCDHIHHCLNGEDEKDCESLVTTGPVHQLRMERSQYYRNLVSLIVDTTIDDITEEFPLFTNESFEETASYSPLCHTGVFCDHYGCYDSQLRRYVEYSPPRLLCSMCGGSQPTCWARHWLNEWRDQSLSATSLKMMMLKQRPDFEDLSQLYHPSHHDQETYAIRPEDFVFACSFDRNLCDYTSFYSWPSDHYGRCYTFNSPNVENATTVTPWPKMITQAGPKNSLRLTLHIESGLSLLTPEVGVRVIIHSPHLLPVPEEEGFNLGPGSSSISISRTLYERLDEPHGICNDEYETKMPFIYSRKLCNELCLEKAIRERCDCHSGVSPAYNALGHIPGHQCDRTHPGDKICMDMVSRDYIGGYLDCRCHEACREMDYKSQVTSSKINPQYYSHLHRNRKAVRSVCASEMEMVNLEIYLETMSYEVISESPTYTWDLLLSNVGGFMGLFIGMSFVTILELLELVVDLLIVVFKPLTPAPSPSDEEERIEKRNNKNNAKNNSNNKLALNPGLGTASWANEGKEEVTVMSRTIELLLKEHHDLNKEITLLKLEQEALKQQMGTTCSEEKTRC